MSTERVVPDPERPGCWLVRVGGADQSWVDPDDPAHLEFDYMQRLADHLDQHGQPGERLRVVHIGGAAMTLARYVSHTRPTSPQIVLEPDAELTAEVRAKIPLGKHSGIKVRPVGGREGIAAMPEDYADVVVLDAFVGARVPGELVGLDFLTDVRRVLVSEGLFLANVTDTHPFDWTRRVLAGLRSTFAHVMLSAESATLKGRRFGNVVIGASPVALPVDRLERRAAGAVFPHRLVHGEHLTRLVGGAQPFFGVGEESPGPPAGRAFFE
ncbi:MULTISPECIES: spermidine synthase [unclassified Luteococcus]|uniref:spermidine synthase n=1 Tax=unclassified Luteococcus TaxID=2639923 RepID=UPI00313F19A5